MNKVPSHGDYTLSGAPRRVKQFGEPGWADDGASEAALTAREVAEILGGRRRFMIVNVWRNISRAAPVRRMPMAFLDNSSVKRDDLLPSICTSRAGAEKTSRSMTGLSTGGSTSLI